jgi:hypothetical protein
MVELFFVHMKSSDWIQLLLLLSILFFSFFYFFSLFFYSFFFQVFSCSVSPWARHLPVIMSRETSPGYILETSGPSRIRQVLEPHVCHVGDRYEKHAAGPSTGSTRNMQAEPSTGITRNTQAEPSTGSTWNMRRESLTVLLETCKLSPR